MENTKLKRATRGIGVLGILAILLSMGCAGKKAEIGSPPWRQASGPVPTGQYLGLALADINGDGNMDAVAGGENSKAVGIWYGDGKGGWDKSEEISIEGTVRGVAAGDLDSDGRDDIAFSVQGEGDIGIQIWMNTADRGWVKGKSPVMQGSYEGLSLVDVNRDGFLDVVAANNTNDALGGVQVWLGDGHGDYIKESGPVNIDRYMDVAVADFNGDGNLDIAAAGNGPRGALRVWLGDGAGGWSPTQPLADGNFYRITVDDFDWDGKLDLGVGSYQHGIMIFCGDGKGNFEKRFTPVESGSFWKVLKTSCDPDGRPALLASSVESGGISTWQLGKDDRWKAVDFQLPSKGTYYDMDRTDLNGDKICDLCVATYGEGVKVWLGKGGAPGPAPAASPSGPASKREEVLPEEVTENEVFSSLAGFPEYRMGPNDLLEITLWRGVEGTKHEVLVRPDGTISFGFVENMPVNGLTPTQLDNQLTEAFKKYMKYPQIDVIVTKHRSKEVTLMGAIRELANRISGPGIYPMKGKSTIYEMLSFAGGPTDDADLQKVSIRRANGRQTIVDLYKFIMLGDRTQNLVLDSGDFVFIPRLSESERRVFVIGQVHKPGVYSIGRRSTVLEAVAMAGGFTDRAKPSSTKIIRGDLSRPEILSADLDKLLSKADQSQNVELSSRDIVYIPQSFIGDLNVFSNQVLPFLNVLLFPGRFRDYYMYSDALRFDVGGTKTTTDLTFSNLP
ncbi:MAG: FG-GAP-like repeat-containing protein [Thermodesulfobacteriota bacterium]